MATRGIFRGLNRARGLNARVYSVGELPSQPQLFPVETGITLTSSASIRPGVALTNATDVDVSGDPHAANVVLFLPMTGANNSTSFTDYSPTPKTVTVYSDAKISTAQSKWGEGAGYFDGTGAVISVPELPLATNYSIRFWLYISVFSSYAIFNSGDAGTQGALIITSNTIYLHSTGMGSYSGKYYGWHHIEINKDGPTSYTLYLDGVKQYGPASAGGLSGLFTIGAMNTGAAYPFIGYINDFQVTNAIRHTSNFTPPTGPLLSENFDTYTGESPALTLYSEASLETPVFADVALRMPAPRLHGTATSSANNRAKLRMPAPRLHGTGGASAALHMPAPRLTATASGPTQATAALRMPAPRLTATATTGISASAALRMPSPRLTAQGGANAALRMPLPRLTGAATAAQTANGHLRMPIPRLHGIATVSAVAFGHLRMPMPRLHGGIGNVAHLRMPMPRLTATATSLAVGVVALSVPYAATAAALDAGEVTTYAVNLNTGAVTTLLLGGFDTLATAHGILYGIRGGTLYKLAGDVDGASTAIPMTLRFAQQDFGTNLVKRISTVYLSSREDNGITLDLIQDEKTAWRYQTATDTAPAYGTHKLKVGRGVAFHTAGLIVKNRAGGKLDLGGMEFLIEPLSRKPR